jgi:hypothetical protein
VAQERLVDFMKEMEVRAALVEKEAQERVLRVEAKNTASVAFARG